MSKFRYRVEKEAEGMKISFIIVLKAKTVLGATIQAAALGKTLGLLLSGPEGY